MYTATDLDLDLKKTNLRRGWLGDQTNSKKSTKQTSTRKETDWSSDVSL